MKILHLLDDWLNKIEGALLIVLLLGMVLLAFAQVILRNVFSAGIIWADILLRHAVLWIGFLGGALGISNKRHINIDAFTHYMPPRWNASFSVFTNLFGAGVCVFLAVAAVKFVANEISSGSFVYGQIPSWYAEIIIPVGFGLFVFHFLARAARNVEEMKKKESPA
ncbi:MAG TPA: TRAP transporter small permease [Bacteroidota bacterium]|nr:TRAP transporter small permease [Bacteroidota bacterium]